MKYSAKDFGACNFNPMTEEPMLTGYPQLTEIIPVEWYAERFLDNIIRYVVMVYDPYSPLIFNERDLNYRKGLAAELSGFDMEEGEIMVKIYNCSYSFVPDLILRYLMRFAKSKEWAAICAFEYTYWESIKELMVPIEGADSKKKLESVQKKSAIKVEIDMDIQRLERYYRTFLGQDDELMNKVKMKMTPEAIANSL